MITSNIIPRLCTLALILTLQAAAQNQPAAAAQTIVKPAYEEEIAAWHTKRLETLQRPQGWLSLVALDWLNEGQNPVKSIGTLTLAKGVVSFHALPGVKARIGENAFSSGVLKTEGGKERPDKVNVGSKSLTIIRRGDRFAVRMWDGDAETLKKFKGIPRFPVSAQWRIEARWEPYSTPKPIKVASVIPGLLEDYTVPGVAVFTINGSVCKLEPVGSGNETLFFIFADQTNGKETYGAGRFLYADPPQDGVVVLDFNKSINPPCAFTSYATCPLPPASNSLKVRIEAGEKSFGDH